MLKKAVLNALNKQMNAEFYSEYLYLSMAAYFQSMSLTGFTHWMKCQAQEEHVHGMKFFNHIGERGGDALVGSMESPPTKWKSPMAAFEHVLKHEQKVTGMINDFVNLSIQEKDHATNQFLQWFVSEQVEEEASASEVLEKLRLVDKTEGGLLMIDTELSARIPVLPLMPPPPGGEKTTG
ncbi:MAG TPA: ferritin [Euryarchaeota archaeon]|nr:ferritin [Euryarchaeota archaeon]